MIYDYKVDPTNSEIFYFLLWSYTEAVVAKSNVYKWTTETYSTLTGFTSQPLNFLIKDTWNNIFVIHNSYFNNKYWDKVYTFGIKESAKVDLEAQ